MSDDSLTSAPNHTSTTASAIGTVPIVSATAAPVPKVSIAPPPFARTSDSLSPQSHPTERSDDPSGSTDSVLIEIRYELYSDFKNQPTIQDTMTLPSALPPVQFRSCIAEAMGLEPSEAKLAYTIFGIARPQPKAVFNTEPQVYEAIKKVKGHIQRARSVKKGLNVMNLDPALKDVDVAPTPSKSSLPKSKVPGKLSKHESAELQKAMRIKHTIFKLRTRLRCQLCRGALCFVDPRTGRHVRCSHDMITLWAKQHHENPEIITLNRPPNTRQFDARRGLHPLVIASKQTDNKDTESNVPGSNSSSAIFVGGDSPPPVKPEPSLDVIDISSDSDSSIDLIDSDSLPDPDNILSEHAAASGDSLAQLLYDLHSMFPNLSFLSFHPEFERLNIHNVQELAAQSVYWIAESTGMSRARALIVLGAAMVGAGKDGAAVDGVDVKGKGKIKAEIE